mmetsp:Transcript_65502/g.188438  ORF Transcript_65502/g.188438 Transcript_65502/m.188438 type:complete len:303 (+) Transcript_65502:460-1368(+)
MTVTPLPARASRLRPQAVCIATALQCEDCPLLCPGPLAPECQDRVGNMRTSDSATNVLGGLSTVLLCRRALPARRCALGDDADHDGVGEQDDVEGRDLQDLREGVDDRSTGNPRAPASQQSTAICEQQARRSEHVLATLPQGEAKIPPAEDDREEGDREERVPNELVKQNLSHDCGCVLLVPEKDALQLVELVHAQSQQRPQQHVEQEVDPIRTLEPPHRCHDHRWKHAAKQTSRHHSEPQAGLGLELGQRIEGRPRRRAAAVVERDQDHANHERKQRRHSCLPQTSAHRCPDLLHEEANSR